MDLYVRAIDGYLSRHFGEETLPQLQHLNSAIRYSLNSGGKKFRPLLALLTAEALGKDFHNTLPFAAAVECVHTYSLIHDDLPCMDNDDIRRGKLTNHKVHGEALALLAGDALLTEAFALLGRNYSANLSSLITEFAGAIGRHGMVGGQAFDMEAKDLDIEQVELLHELKTGSLIRLAVSGAALINGASSEELKCFSEYGRNLGYAFQLADDLLDANQNAEKQKNMAAVVGNEKAKKMLVEVSKKAKSSLAHIKDSENLLRMIDENLSRVL